jgi:outer membrane receptor protein involved in Fe transport
MKGKDILLLGGLAAGAYILMKSRIPAQQTVQQAAETLSEIPGYEVGTATVELLQTNPQALIPQFNSLGERVASYMSRAGTIKTGVVNQFMQVRPLPGQDFAPGEGEILYFI